MAPNDIRPKSSWFIKNRVFVQFNAWKPSSQRYRMVYWIWVKTGGAKEKVVCTLLNILKLWRSNLTQSYIDMFGSMTCHGIFWDRHTYIWPVKRRNKLEYMHPHRTAGTHVSTCTCHNCFSTMTFEFSNYCVIILYQITCQILLIAPLECSITTMIVSTTHSWWPHHF